MRAGPWPRSAVAGVVATLLIAVTAPVARADDAALAGWLNDAIPHISAVHLAENNLVVALAAKDAPSPESTGATDFDALKAPCDSLSSARAELQDLLPTPDQELTPEFQQAVDDIETAAEECTTVIRERVTDQRAARAAILAPLVDAADHLAAADSILSKLATPEPPK